MFDVEGFILVGGASRRMGQDKAQLLLGSQTVLEHVAQELAAATSSVTLVGAQQAYQSLSLPKVADVHEKWGALGGIHAALSAGRSDWILVVACDLPFITRELFARLHTRISQSVDAVVPVQPDGLLQPICALYRPETCLPQVEKLIGAGERTPRALLMAVRTEYVLFRELGDLPGAENFFLNVNTPEDFERARQLIQTGR